MTSQPFEHSVRPAVPRQRDRPRGEGPDWDALIAGVLADPGLMRLVFQPIVSLDAAEIVGYEALARFAGPRELTPDTWFAAADRLGHGVELEARVVSQCLALRSSLPANCFLTVNVSPHLVIEPAFADLLRSAGDLAPLVIELTEHRQVHDLPSLVALRNELTAQGAIIALDDAGSGYSGLQQMSAIRPHLIKLDRTLVTDADQDEVKLALAELLGGFAGRLDAWLLAEGIETWGELDAFVRLGVPLAQGYLLGRPAEPWARLDPQVAQRLRSSRARVRLTDHMASLMEQAALGTAPQPGTIGVELDHHRRPVRLLVPCADPAGGPTHREAVVSLRVHPSTSVVEAAQRLLSRPEHTRFDPVVCIGEEGEYVGVVRLERILLRLTETRTG